MQINWLAVLLAFVVGMVVAFAWYQRGRIARIWELHTGVTPERSRHARGRNIAQLILANAVTAVGLALAITIAWEAFDTRSPTLAVLVAVAAWLAFSASTLLQHNAFELKPAALTVINVAYQFTVYLGMSGAIGLLPPAS